MLGSRGPGEWSVSCRGPPPRLCQSRHSKYPETLLQKLLHILSRRLVSSLSISPPKSISRASLWTISPRSALTRPSAVVNLLCHCQKKPLSPLTALWFWITLCSTTPPVEPGASTSFSWVDRCYHLAYQPLRWLVEDLVTWDRPMSSMRRW